MALLNIFKGKKGKFQKRSEKRGHRKTQESVVLSKKEVKSKPLETKKLVAKVSKKDVHVKKTSKTKRPQHSVGQKRKGGAQIAPKILQFPRITEKATLLQQNDQYIFRVFPTATKPEIKKSIEEIYGVDVLAVRIINVKRKKKRLGRSQGFQPGYKKAIIRTKKGQTIEVMPT